MQISTYNVFGSSYYNKGTLLASNAFKTPPNTSNVLRLPPNAPIHLQTTPNGCKHLQMAPSALPKLQGPPKTSNKCKSALHVHTEVASFSGTVPGTGTPSSSTRIGVGSYWSSIEQEERIQYNQSLQTSRAMLLEWDMAFFSRPLLILVSKHISKHLSSYSPHISSLSYPTILHTCPPYLILLSTTLLHLILSSYTPHSSTISYHPILSSSLLYYTNSYIHHTS